MFRHEGASVFRRILLGIGANAVGKLWVIGLQFLTVPVLVTKWGASGYGIWLMLSAMPTYMALSDLGFGTAAGVDMTKRVALNDNDGALTAFQSAWVFVSTISIALSLIAICIWLLRYRIRMFQTHEFDDLLNASMLLFCYSLIVLQINLVSMAFRSTGRYAQGTLLVDIFIPTEGVALIIVALIGGRYVACAATILGLRTIGFGLVYIILRRTVPWVRFGASHASMSEIRNLAKPALAALTLPLSAALNIQGAIFLIGLAVSPAAAAMFGTVRAISRVPLQLVGILSRATLPEMAAAYARKDQGRMNQLVGVNLVAVILTALPAALLLSLLGQWLVSVLSRGHLTAPIGLLVIMSLVMILQTFWSTIGMLLLALNLQQRFSHIYLGLTVTSSILCYLIASAYGLEAVTLLFLFVDGIMTLAIIRIWDREFQPDKINQPAGLNSIVGSVRFAVDFLRRQLV